jgi:ubiquinone/menaquinone biosynthesis C-methylase UbiE
MHAATDSYDVFAPESSAFLIRTAVALGRFAPGSQVADLGCGSGVFSNLLRQQGCVPTGLDISPKLIELGRRKYPDIEFLEGDVENLPFADASFDGVLLGGLVHHLPDPSRCAAEVYRVLRPGGRFVAFDPNRMNPFMWLYRDHASPFYSPIGVTANERPVLAKEAAASFRAAGFSVRTEYLSNLRYRYVASARVRWLLPIYNAIDSMLFAPSFMRPLRSFVLTIGAKP